MPYGTLSTRTALDLTGIDVDGTLGIQPDSSVGCDGELSGHNETVSMTGAGSSYLRNQISLM